MAIILANAELYRMGKMQRKDLAVSENGWTVFDHSDIGRLLSERQDLREAEVFDLSGCVLLPGFTDVHVHFREPGFSYKGTVRTGSLSACRGGFTQVMTMPNLKPAPSNVEAVQEELDIIRRDAIVRVTPYGTITKKQNGRGPLSDMESIAPLVCGFSDDGKGIQDEGLMRDAMSLSKELGKLIAAHCEDESLVGGCDLHAGRFASSHGLTGITSESEWRQIERDVRLSDDTGCAYHVCHVSAKESIEIIRDAKKSGINVTCETGPHYLTLTDEALAEFPLDSPEIARYKMYPPLRDEQDRKALIQGLLDGTVDMIATDHAPHSKEEKSRGLHRSANGVIGLETSFPVMYTKFVETGLLTLPMLVEKMSLCPNKRFGIPVSSLFTSSAASGTDAPDLTVQNITDTYKIDPSEFASMGRSTPFEGWEVHGKTVMTFLGGKKIYG
ncbi:MAG: dihydroorotase [Eubacteriales bacterium]|nr:dihydroorotase [Eubacteriales bacterium]